MWQMSSGVGLCTGLTEITYRVTCRVRGASFTMVCQRQWQSTSNVSCRTRGAGSSRARSTSASGRIMDHSVALFCCQFYHARTGHTSFLEQNVRL